MSERKSFQVVMKPEVQKRLKQRSKTMGVPIGTMIENLLSSLEFRLERCAEKTGKEVHELSDKHIFTLTHGILLDDSKGGGTKHTVEATKLVINELVDDEEEALKWRPGIRLTENDVDELNE